MKNRSAFTLIELIFVIVVLGILASVALPKLGKNLQHAQIAKAQGEVAAIRTSIASARQKLLVTGVNAYPSTLDNGATLGDGQKLFDTNGTVEILGYPKYSKSSSGNWKKNTAYNAGTGVTLYQFNVDGTNVIFSYDRDNGLFDCHNVNTDAQAVEFCKTITE